MKLSIVVPCCNEEATLDTLLGRVWGVDLAGVAKQIVIVDDGSTDGSLAIARRWANTHPEHVEAIALGPNRGKGAAVAAGLERVDGQIVIIQDADLEYDPRDYRRILAKHEEPGVQIVYGSRILGNRNRSYRRYYWGGRLLSLVTNLLYHCHITDESTCYKSWKRQVLDRVRVESRGFGFCAEITGKVLCLGYRIHEVPVRYYPRRFEQGKKIRARDALIAIWHLLKHRFWP